MCFVLIMQLLLNQICKDYNYIVFKGNISSFAQQTLVIPPSVFKFSIFCCRKKTIISKQKENNNDPNRKKTIMIKQKENYNDPNRKKTIIIQTERKQ